ncbi:MAG: HlyD family efflux transporter periplasmic adaptor subunit [Anaerolineae bacterium]|nr:HlyD family efflux transporter periplasmic adaptor subunit [Anaerolineae bacterium]
MKRRTILYIVLGVVLVAAVAAMIVWRTQQAQTSDEETNSAVVERGTLLVAVSASGSVEPQSSVGLTFETPAQVTDVSVKVGDRVETGDVLAQLDTRQLELQVHQAQAALAAAKAQLAQIEAGPRPEEVTAAEADLRAAQAQVSGAVANLDQLKSGSTEAQIAAAETQVAQAELQHKLALLEYDRVRAIKAKEEKIEQAAYDLYTAEKSLAAAQAALADAQAGTDTDDLRVAQANVDGAVAQQDAAQARLDLLLAGATEEQIADAEAQVERAQAALEQADLSLKRATLYAPFDGVVARVNVSAGEIAPVGLAAITLLDPSGLQIAIGVDELDVGRLAVGQSAQVTLDALPDITLNGTVKSIAPAATVDQGGVTYYDVIVTLEPTDAPVRADMTANVTIVIEELTDVLTIPLWVVRVDRRTGQTYVNQRAGDEIERVDIALGVRYEGVAQVLYGLAEGDEALWVSESPFDFGNE